MMMLKDARDIKLLVSTIKKCKSDVILRSVDGSEEFNLKSTLSQYLAIGKLCAEHGDEYEVFCMNSEDEPLLFEFFTKLKK